MSAFVANDAPRDPLETAAEWCMRLAEGTLPPQSQAEFDAWLAQGDNMAVFERVAGTWDSIGELAAAPEAIAFRTEALEAYRAANEARWARKATRPKLWGLGIAAVLATAAIPATLWYQSWPDVYETDIGQRQVARLDDGTRVSLDADTQIDARIGDESRQVTLSRGRAKFDVAKDALRPFSVRVGSKQVVATGTSFSVEVIKGQMRVVLYEGRVAVLDQASTRPLKLAGKASAADLALRPGMELVAPIQGETATVLASSLDKASSWEAGQLSLDDEPLALAVDRVNRYSQKKVVLADARVGQLRVSGVYNAGDVDAFAVGVSAVLPVSVKDGPSEIIISSR